MFYFSILDEKLKLAIIKLAPCDTEYNIHYLYLGKIAERSMPLHWFKFESPIKSFLNLKI